ncbi:hypothetical protein L5G28_07545 [Gordonia sp. HY285]|uniref:hypothetical protein n=1 Tax=Gordonia liuliyuniae TaxID=2911517 RepID=UPI001F22D072|nr:hypothetical protein [Gordonia liuliyuniae]MCF8610014.1 hypothetical protein [Gordonia liuliyuniae]
MTDPAIDAARRRNLGREPNPHEAAIAREALAPIAAALAQVRERYDELTQAMLAADNAATTSRYANEAAGVQYVYDLVWPHVYRSEGA